MIGLLKGAGETNHVLGPLAASNAPLRGACFCGRLLDFERGDGVTELFKLQITNYQITNSSDYFARNGLLSLSTPM
jgi:hypothetical protein